MKNFFLNTLTTAFNKALSLDPENFEKLKTLNTKLIQLDITKPTVTLFLEFNEAGVRVLSRSALNENLVADIIIKGSALELIKLSRQSHFNLYESNIKITGDMGVADALRKIFSQLDIDWEGGLAEYTGDVAAHHLGQFARRGLAWLKSARANLHQDIKEYAQEEVRVLPTRLEMDRFTSEVAKLRDDTERLEARLKGLSKTI
jgi:ubiquinone biosynthesis protein UbiJ